MRLADDGCPWVETPFPPARLTPAEVEAVMAGHEAMVWQIAHRLHKACPAGSLDDLASAIRTRLVHAAVHNFDPSRGWKFITYAWPVAVRAGREFLTREAARGIYAPTNYAVERPGVVYDSEAAGHGREDDSPLADAAAREADARPEFSPDFWRVVTHRLNARHAEALRLRYRDGLTLAEVGERMGVSRARAQQMEQKALHEIKTDATLVGYLRDLLA